MKLPKCFTHAIALFSLMVFLCFSFQNCTSPKFTSMLDSRASETEHGQGYGGKLQSDYYRLVHNFTCEKTEAPVSSIHWNNDIGLLIENRTLQCSSVSLPLSKELVDISIYQKDVIGYKEGIFEGLETKPAKIPANLVEIWCRDRNDELGIETITHFDISTQQAVNKIYYSSLQNGTYIHRQIIDTPVSRLVGANEITVSDSNGFLLKVFRDQPAAQPGLFVGKMEALIDNQKVSRETTCRLGGSLDPKVWPSTQIVDFNTRTFLMSADKSKAVFTSDSETGIMNIYGMNGDGANPYKIAQNKSNTVMASLISDYQFSSDSSTFLYAGDQNQTNIYELFKFDLNNSPGSSNAVQLSNSGESVSQYMLSNDKQFAVYSGFSVSGGNKTLWLKSVRLAGGSGPLLIDSMPSFATAIGSQHFNLSTTQRRIVYLDGDGLTRNKLWSVNFDGTDKRELPVPLPSNDWNLDDLQVLKIPANGDFVFVRAVQAMKAIKVYRVSVDGSGALELPMGLHLQMASSSQRFGLLGMDPELGQELNNFNLFDFNTHKSSSLPGLIPNSIFFSRDSKLLVGQKVQQDGRSTAVMISTTDTTWTELCPAATSRYLHIEELDENEFLLVSVEETGQNLNVFTRRLGEGCRKVNSVPGTPLFNFGSFQMSVAPDKKKILASITSHATNGDSKKSRQQLLYIPLNGQPPLLVSTPAFAEGAISQSWFLGDSRTVIYTGTQLIKDQQNAFRWVAP